MTPLLLLLAMLPSQSSQSKNRYAVIIGNNAGRSSERPLAYAERDATRVSSVLNRLGGLPPENTVTLLGEDRDAIRRALLDINARVRLDDADATLIVYYSGHADAEGLHPGEAPLSYDELRAFLTGSPARVRILILDGCRSGGVTNVKGVEPAPTFAVTQHMGEQVEGLAMISSSAAGEDSHESQRLEASFFTHHFLSALQGAGDRNTDGRITLTEAYEYAYHNTLRSSGRTTSLQHPTYAYDMKGRGDLIITRLDRASPRSAQLVLGRPGPYMVLEQREGGEVVAEVDAQKPQTRLLLLPGRYFVQARSEDHYREYQVELTAGGTQSLDELDYDQIAYAELVRKGAPEKRISHGLFLSGAVRGPILEGQTVGAGAMLSYVGDLPWASLSVRARFGTTAVNALDTDLDTAHQEIALGLAGQRFFDVAGLSLGIGLLAEGLYHRQRFSGPRALPTRGSFGMAFGALLTMEVLLVDGLALRVEGAPMTYLLRRAETNGGVEVRGSFTSRFTAWGAVGLGWRL